MEEGETRFITPGTAAGTLPQAPCPGVEKLHYEEWPKYVSFLGASKRSRINTIQRSDFDILFQLTNFCLKPKKLSKAHSQFFLFLVCGGRRRKRPLNTQSGILPAVYFCHGPSFILLPASDLQQGKAKGQENNKINSDVVINIGLYHLHRRQYVDRVFCKSKMIYNSYQL